MTNKQALREAAEKATPGKWRRASTRFNGITAQSAYPLCGKEDILANAAEKRDAEFIAAANPATVLALLDELEAAENRNDRLESIVTVAEQRNALMREWKRALKVPCDLVDDQVPLVIHSMVLRLDRLKETEEKLKSAEDQIAELVTAGIITRIEG